MFKLNWSDIRARYHAGLCYALFAMLQYVVFDSKALQRKYCTWYSIRIVKGQIKSGKLHFKSGILFAKKRCVFIKCLRHRKSLKWMKRCCSQAHEIIFIRILVFFIDFTLLRNRQPFPVCWLSLPLTSMHALFGRRFELIEIYPRNKICQQNYYHFVRFRTQIHPNRFQFKWNEQQNAVFSSIFMIEMYLTFEYVDHTNESNEKLKFIPTNWCFNSFFVVQRKRKLSKWIIQSNLLPSHTSLNRSHLSESSVNVDVRENNQRITTHNIIWIILEFIIHSVNIVF